MLKKQALDMKGYKPFIDPKTKTVINEWLIKRTVTDYALELTKRFENILQCNIKPRFYIQQKGFTLPPHIDRGTTCCINIVLKGEKNPIIFHINNKQYAHVYDMAILDVTKKHEVTASNEERILFKMSIFDKSFSQIVKKWYQRN